MKKILVVAVILLIVSSMVFSSVGAVNTKSRQQCNPSIDIESEVWDEKNGIWVDADTQNKAFDVTNCTEINLRLTVTNTGDCPLYYVGLLDSIEISLKYISADPTPEDVDVTEYATIIIWFIWGVMAPGQIEHFYITAHVEGEGGTYSETNAGTSGSCYHGISVSDEDDCWIHSIKKSRTFNSTLLNYLQRHSNLFPLLQKLLLFLK